MTNCDESPFLKSDAYVAEHYVETYCQDELEYYSEEVPRMERKLACEIRQRP